MTASVRDFLEEITDWRESCDRCGTTKEVRMRSIKHEDAEIGLLMLCDKCKSGLEGEKLAIVDIPIGDNNSRNQFPRENNSSIPFRRDLVYCKNCDQFLDGSIGHNPSHVMIKVSGSFVEVEG